MMFRYLGWNTAADLLLKGLNGAPNQVIQVGFSGDASSQIILASVTASLDELGIGTGNTLSYSLTGDSVSDAVSASELALTALTSALDQVLARRGTVGAAESRLRSAINTITVMRENRIAAESQVRDVDVAENVAQLARLQVLNQYQTALLAQSNLDSKIALKLLGVG
jgi:flagellin